LSAELLVWACWICSGVVWFSVYRHSLAVSICVVGATLLLPSMNPGLSWLIGLVEFEFTKYHAASLALIFGYASVGLISWSRSKQSAKYYVSRACKSAREEKGFLLDLPMALFCLVPIATSISHGESATGGIPDMLDHVLHWGIPFWIARRVYVDKQAVGDLMLVIMCFGLLYVPICLFEIWAGPSYYLEVLLFGGEVANDGHTFRMGGWRPHGMLGNGIRLGRWMTVATLVTLTIGIANFPNRLSSNRPFTRSAIWWATGVLFATTILVKSFSWLYILAIGAVLLVVFSASLNRRRICCVALAASCVITLGVMTVRILNLVDPAPIVRMVERFSQPSAGSLQFRLTSERIYADMTIDSEFKWLGDNLIPNRYRYPYYSDQRYIFNLKRYGLIGLFLWLSTLVIPLAFAVRVLWKGETEDIPSIVVFVWSFLVAAVLWDCLFNAFVNPIFLLGCGLLLNAKQKIKRKPVRRQIEILGRRR
jgi:hypothetical protein